jgi:tRNA pseudouridine32 synthase/23S rRNA pseudouridine746 synthase
MPPILFQDDRFVVLDKPAGLSRRRTGPWLAHRLDADTAGCLVVALRRAALHAAQACFAGGAARKEYWAVVHGRPHADAGVIDAPLLKRTDRTGWRMVVDPGGAKGGQPATTEWRIMGVGVHCAAALGCPLLGDPVYGDGQGALHLLARSITLPLDPPLAALAQPPDHMRAALIRCGWTP